jgi:acyl-CoA thioesterase II
VGRSFTTRRVVAHQSNGAILTLDASFQRFEEDLDVQEPELAADVASPIEFAPEEWSGFGEVRVRREPTSKRFAVWMRATDDLSGDPVAKACALAYLSDYGPMDAILLSHPRSQQWDEFMAASLDHVVWFHRPIPDGDGWLLFDLNGHGLANARGMSTGSVFTSSGLHVATVAQEGLARSPRVPGANPGR